MISFPLPKPLLAMGKPGRLARLTLSRPGLLHAPIEGPRGICNFGDIRCRWRSFPPLQDPQKSGGSFRKCFDWLLGLFVHDANHEGVILKCPTKPLTRVSV